MAKVTKTWDESDYKSYKQKWSNKKEYEVVNDVYTRFRTMYTSRRTSCPFATPFSETHRIEDDDVIVEEGKGTGTDWVEHWSRMIKTAKMYHTYEMERSNLKAPTSFAPIQALMAEFQENNVDVLLTPTEDADSEKVKIHESLHKFWSNKSDVQRYKATTFLETIELGSSIPFVGWMEKERKVDLVLTGKETEKEIEYIMEGEEEQRQEAIDKVYKEQRPLIKKDTIYEYRGEVYIPTSLFEIYVDPDARQLRGPAYEAVDVAWVQQPSLEQFRAEFKNSKDSFIIKKNIDKVRSAKVAEGEYGESTPFFKAPHDITGDRIQLIRYFNKQTDKYIIIANDVLIRKGPLPFNHKELPFVRHFCYEWKDQFYGFGIPAALESVQAMEETLQNLKIDQMKIDLNPPVLVNSDIFDDIDYGWEEIRPGMKVEVGGDVGPSNVRWFDRQKVDFDYYRMHEVLRENGIVITGINPLAYSVPKPGEPVRTHIISMESTLKMAKRIFKNWAEGWKEAVRQLIKIREQKLPDAYVERVVDEENTMVKKYPSIRTEGVQLGVEFDEMGGIKLGEEEVIGYGSFNLGEILELESDFLTLDGEMDIQVDTDTIVPTSSAVQVELINRAMGQLIPILSNPDLLTSPGVVQLLREYIEKNGLSTKIIENLEDESTQQEIQDAKDQVEAMKGGQNVSGIPGESEAHKFTHAMDLIKFQAEKEELLESPENATMDVVMFLDEMIKKLSKHIIIDDSQKSESTRIAVEQAQPAPMEGQQMMEGQPMMQEQMPMMGGAPMSPMGGAPIGPIPQGVPTAPGEFV